jgi:hypothetical protein
MARRRRVEVGGLNIRVHPHESNQVYLTLLEDAYDLRMPLKARGDQQLLMSYLGKPNDRGEVQGIVSRFTEIDQSQPWFNVRTNDEAKESEVRKISIPEYLKPNLQSFSFTFFSKKHILVFDRHSQNSSITHGVVERYFTRLFEAEDIVDKYGVVDIDIIKDAKGLHEILNIPELKHLEILIKRPNPDTLGDLNDRVLGRLSRQHASKYEQKLTSIPSESLQPDEKTKQLAEVAVNNGYVKGDGKDGEGKPVAISTLQYPKTSTHFYDPDETAHSDAFNIAARALLKSA